MVKRSPLGCVYVIMETSRCVAASRCQSIDHIRVKYAVLGDIHANLEALTAVLQDAKEQRCTHYACVGDIVGYNANPKECLDIIRDMGMPCVKGNHDDTARQTAPWKT